MENHFNFPKFYIIILIFLFNCVEPQKNQQETNSTLDLEQESFGLTIEQKAYIKKRFQLYAKIKAKFDETKKSDGASIGELNRSLSEINEFPSWFSENTPEILHLKLVKSFVIDMGIALASQNDQLLEIARNDYNKYSKELQEMLE